MIKANPKLKNQNPKEFPTSKSKSQIIIYVMVMVKMPVWVTVMVRKPVCVMVIDYRT